MSPEESQNLTDRVEALERENRRLRRWGGLGVLALAVVVAAAWQSPAAEVVETTELRLVDADGTLRARLGPGDPEDGGDGVTLSFADRTGQGSLSLGVQDRFPGLRIVRDGRSLLRLGPEQIVVGSDGGSTDRSPGLRLTPTRIEGYNFISMGWGLQGELELFLDDRRVYFGPDGEVLWEGDPGP